VGGHEARLEDRRLWKPACANAPSPRPAHRDVQRRSDMKKPPERRRSAKDIAGFQTGLPVVR